MKKYTKLLIVGLPFFLASGVAADYLMNGISFGLAVMGVIIVISSIVSYCDTPSEKP